MNAIRVRTSHNPPMTTLQGIVHEERLADVQGPPNTGKWLDGQRLYYHGPSNTNPPWDNSLPLIPGMGYWIRAYIECELIIPKPN